METIILARAWTGGRIERVRVRVGPDRSVLVWDPIAGHYTRCHVLAAGAVRRARAAVHHE